MTIFTLIACSQKPLSKKTTPTPLENTLKLSQEWMLNFQADSGLLHYVYRPVENSFDDDNNLVRQVGSLWGFAQTLEGDIDTEKARFIDTFLDAIEENMEYHFLGNQEIGYLTWGNIAKTNTTALYILALLELESQGYVLSPEREKALHKVALGLELMASSGGGFWYIYFFPRAHNKVSAYATGEALFALTKYHKAYPNARPDLKDFLEVQYKTYFEENILPAKNFQDPIIRGFFAWGMYFLNEMDDLAPVDYEKYVKPMLVWALEERVSTFCAIKGEGCISGVSAGEASFMEGFLAAYPLVKKYDPPFVLEIEKYLHPAAQMFMDLQVTSVENFETKVQQNFTGEDHYLIGGFCQNPECALFRNDYNQHAMTALFWYKSWLPEFEFLPKLTENKSVDQNHEYAQKNTPPKEVNNIEVRN